MDGGKVPGKESRGSGGTPFLIMWLIKDNAIEAKTEGGVSPARVMGAQSR